MKLPATRIRLFACMLILASSCGCSGKPQEGPVEVEPISNSSTDMEQQRATADATDIHEQDTEIVHQTEDDSETGESFTGKSYALLVGCTTYDHLGEDARLRGPINDVLMMRDFLISHFKFDNENIRRLTEADEGASVVLTDRPIKANIVRELKHLKNVVEKGDRVVLLLSGHGSQQPDNDPENKDDPEPDGLDEIFCPADLNVPENPSEPYCVNALTDDELREAINGIRSKGAFVWAIIDSCHSGSAVRGTEVYRQISPDRLIPPAALAKARASAHSGTRSISADNSSSFDTNSKEGGLVALYAAQPHEPTLEMPLPHDSETAEWRGLLTYTMIKVLTNAETPLSYQELVQRIHSEYIYSYGRLGPTPMIEGVDQNLEVLGQTEHTSTPYVLSVNEQGRYIVNVGRLHGFDTGTIFSVYPPAGETKTEEPLGFVRIVQSHMSDSVVISISGEDLPAQKDLPIGGRIEASEVRYGDMSLKIGLQDESPQESKFGESLHKTLLQIQNDSETRIQLVDDLSLADWIVNCSPNEQVVLIPAEGWNSDENVSYFGPAPNNEIHNWLENRLRRVARVKNLLKLCDISSKQHSGGLFSFLSSKRACAIKTKLLSLDSNGDLTRVNWTKRNWTLNDGEQVVLEVKNTGSESIDFSVLFIDSEFGITPLFPSFGVVADNRLEPGQSYSVGPMEVESSTLGLEHLVVIGTRAAGQPIDFSWLAQDSLEAATRAHVNNSTTNLLRETLFSNQKTRGIKMADADTTVLKAVSWKTVRENSINGK